MTILKLCAIFALIIALMAGAFYWYFSYSQNAIDTLEQNTAKLTQALQIQQQAMQDQVDFEKQQNSNLVDLQQKLQDATTAETKLQNAFINTNLDDLGRKNPAALEAKINAATKKAIQDLINDTKAK